MTGGKGEFHMEFSHYAEAPANVRDKIVAEAGAGKAASRAPALGYPPRLARGSGRSAPCEWRGSGAARRPRRSG